MKGKYGAENLYIHVYTSQDRPFNEIYYYQICCATSMSLRNTLDHFSSHKHLLLFKVEKDGGKKLLLQGPTTVSQVPLYEHLDTLCFSNNHIPERLGLVHDAVTAAVSRRHPRTEYQSPFFPGPAHLIQFC